jgi:signal transduction histidine kinase
MRVSISARELERGNKIKAIELSKSDIHDIAYKCTRAKSNTVTRYNNKIEVNNKSLLVEKAARLAHDMHSPIATIEMSLHMLTQKIENESIAVIKMALQSMREITNSMLDSYHMAHDQESDVDSVHSESDNQTITWHELIHKVVLQKKYEWGSKINELSYVCLPNAKNVILKLKPNEAKRMISNLLNNAVEACENLATINIKLEKTRNNLRLSIIDNGVGMPTDQIKYFMRGESTKHPGRGMGLSGAYSFMKSIGGELTVNSILNNGTTIMLDFLSIY